MTNEEFLASYEQRLQEERRQASVQATRYQDRRDRSATRKARLADKLIDGARLIACLRFYCHVLTPGKLVKVEDVRQYTDAKQLRWRRYLEASRRILGIQYGRSVMAVVLPNNYEKRLRRIGLCQNPAAAAQFKCLSPNLEIDASTQIFADTRPHLIPNVQNVLRGEGPPLNGQPYYTPEADTRPPGWLMHSTDPDPEVIKNAKSPFKIAKGNPLETGSPCCEPSNKIHYLKDDTYTGETHDI